MSETATFEWTHEQVGIAIDGVAKLVGPENRGGAESKMLRELQHAYAKLAAASSGDTRKERGE